MSYASRLVAMSSGTLAARPIGITKHMEQEQVAPTTAPPTTRTPDVLASAPAPPTAQAVLAPPPVVAPRPSAPAAEPRLASAPVVAPFAEPRETSPRAPVPFVAERAVVPAVAAAARLPEWLADRPDRIDPLEHLDAGAELAQLLRAAREWTTSAPAPIAPPPAPTIGDPAPHPAAPLAATASMATYAPQVQSDPLEVSIGNVTITVEDAPAPPRRERAERRAPGSVSSRLARHYIRGGG